MFLARYLLLVAIAVTGCAAFTATSAYAQSVEVVAEGGEHCGEVVEEAAHDVSGGCEVAIRSLFGVATFVHNGVTEVQTSACEYELTANFSEDGSGYMDTHETSVHEFPPGCPVAVCDEPATGTSPHAELEWPIGGILESGGGSEEMILTFCVRAHFQPEGLGSVCSVVLSVDQNPSTHVITFSVDQAPCHENPDLEVSGSWQTVGEEEIELVHTHYPFDQAPSE